MDMQNKKGQFVKGTHWREHKPFWEREWLYAEYVTSGKSSGDIAAEHDVTEAAIIFWLRKHNIPRRSMKEVRSLKHWGLSGSANGMFGRTGKQNPRWLGGVTPERQSLYSSQEWADVSKSVWKRDKGICQKCAWSKNPREMQIHHIVSFSEKEMRAELSNLVLLCEDCHRWVHSRKNTGKEFVK
jgi:hypothetical protein